jgi:hypothetical protein
MIQRYPDSTMSSCGMNNVVFDGFSDHIDELISKGVSKETANLLRQELCQINPFLRDLVALGSALQFGDVLPPLTSRMSVNAHQEELSILRNQDQGQEYSTVYQLGPPGYNDRFLDSKSRDVEPVMYPLLHPYGERAYSESQPLVFWCNRCDRSGESAYFESQPLVFWCNRCDCSRECAYFESLSL